MGTLYMVASPIGNLGDITLRAIETLKEVDVVACEDTRHTLRLLNHLSISGKRLIATHAHNEEESAKGIVKLLEEGNNIAYLSDAGTPGISDPGAKVVALARQMGFKVVPIPGPSALAALISVAGLTGKSLLFEGFLPIKEGKRKRRLEELLERNEAFIIYESPFRVVKLLGELAQLAPTRALLVGREMTKIYEEFVEGSALEVEREFAARPSIKGEFALCIYPERGE
ncbi:MAG: 16S rRNA (cytidine(1402)-2'-O)-methyltransferase [Sphaerochaetaceae bacterium]|jgi:16S rRNA (cytidine1402-2'-O)-methyltransferase|nr:16S rRNA (cytidine(1402)-2'-O)-methyltransferase [Sphaerochaetaceae bacterium]